MRTTVLAAAIVCLAAPSPTSAQSEGRIRVIGRAQIEVVPDFVAVRVSVLSDRANSRSGAGAEFGGRAQDH